MCVQIMAPMGGDMEIVDNTVEEVLSDSIRKTESGVGSAYGDQEKRSDKKSGDGLCVERLEARVAMFEKELMKLRDK